MLDNIRDHSLVVAKISHLIARSFRDAGLDISILKATAGALMHDIGKTSSLNTSRDHSEIGRQICIENRLYEIAGIVGEHVRLKNYCLKEDYSEKEIVYYADKRVNHDKIVSLEDRLIYILDRYGRDNADIRRSIEINFKLCKSVEEKLFRKLTFSPEALHNLAKHENIGEI